ncbi:hypothetical protein BDW71DRAFT_204917 [Aspergillus fruticulosus]
MAGSDRAAIARDSTGKWHSNQGGLVRMSPRHPPSFRAANGLPYVDTTFKEYMQFQPPGLDDINARHPWVLVATGQGNREVEFLIPDDKLDAAKSTLAATGFKPYTSVVCGSCVRTGFLRTTASRTPFRQMDFEQRAAAMSAVLSFARYHPVAAVQIVAALVASGSPGWPPAEDDWNLTSAPPADCHLATVPGGMDTPVRQ